MHFNIQVCYLHDTQEERGIARYAASKAAEKKRRQRSSIGQRNHVCGCNKEYLSYPALYTHVKIKHGGVFPFGSISRKIVEASETKEAPKNLSLKKEDVTEQMKDFLEKVIYDPKGSSVNVTFKIT